MIFVLKIFKPKKKSNNNNKIQTKNISELLSKYCYRDKGENGLFFVTLSLLSSICKICFFLILKNFDLEFSVYENPNDLFDLD